LNKVLKYDTSLSVNLRGSVEEIFIENFLKCSAFQSTIYRTVIKFHANGSALNRKKKPENTSTN
jgi:hypothetical protein